MRLCQAFDLKSSFLCTKALLFGLLVCTFPAHSVHAQNVPSSIRLIVPFPAGGLVDLAARLRGDAATNARIVADAKVKLE